VEPSRDDRWRWRAGGQLDEEGYTPYLNSAKKLIYAKTSAEFWAIWKDLTVEIDGQLHRMDIANAPFYQYLRDNFVGSKTDTPRLGFVRSAVVLISSMRSGGRDLMPMVALAFTACRFHPGMWSLFGRQDVAGSIMAAITTNNVAESANRSIKEALSGCRTIDRAIEALLAHQSVRFLLAVQAENDRGNGVSAGRKRSNVGTLIVAAANEYSPGRFGCSSICEATDALLSASVCSA
jgi:hypothetical protein